VGAVDLPVVAVAAVVAAVGDRTRKQAVKWLVVKVLPSSQFPSFALAKVFLLASRRLESKRAIIWWRRLLLLSEQTRELFVPCPFSRPLLQKLSALWQISSDPT